MCYSKKGWREMERERERETQRKVILDSQIVMDTATSVALDTDILSTLFPHPFSDLLFSQQSSW